MQQRQPRVGDIVEDYCPRERRLSDHAVVAMVGDTIRQSRCTTCDTEHEYREGKVPATRKKTAGALAPKPPAAAAPAVVAKAPVDADAEPAEAAPPAPPEPVRPEAPPPAGLAAAPTSDQPAPPAHEGPVHRRLIRAVLPRIEGEVPTRQAPEFTMHTANQRPASNGRGFRQGGTFGGNQRQGGGAHNGHGRSHGARAAGQGGGHAGRGGHGAHGAGRPHGRAHHDSGHASRRKH